MYGLNRFIDDIEFMLGIQLSVYWKISWAYLIPATLISIFCYSVSSYQPLTDGSYVYPQQAISGFSFHPLSRDSSSSSFLKHDYISFFSGSGSCSFPFQPAEAPCDFDGSFQSAASISDGMLQLLI